MTSQFNLDAKLKVSFDTDDAKLEFARLNRGLDDLTRKDLAATLERLFQQTQRQVHVLSGALKASGKRRITDNAKHWRGTITYGGSTTVRRMRQRNRPFYVDYAEIENNLEGVRVPPTRPSRRKNAKPGDREIRTSDLRGGYGTPHEFFDDDEIQAAFNVITQRVLDWLAKEDVKKAKRRAYNARKAAEAGKPYTPRNS